MAEPKHRRSTTSRLTDSADSPRHKLGEVVAIVYVS